MKKFVLEFIRRGLVACGFGPLVLAIIYLILQKSVGVKTLTVNEVCIGIFSLTVLAFIAGGMNIVYQMERLPLMVAILIHGVVLYISYLGTYLVNGWLENGKLSLWVFTCIFVVGYLVIWAIIYSVVRKDTEKVNKVLEEKRKNNGVDRV